MARHSCVHDMGNLSTHQKHGHRASNHSLHRASNGSLPLAPHRETHHHHPSKRASNGSFVPHHELVLPANREKTGTGSDDYSLFVLVRKLDREIQQMNAVIIDWRSDVSKWQSKHGDVLDDLASHLYSGKPVPSQIDRMQCNAQPVPDDEAPSGDDDLISLTSDVAAPMQWDDEHVKPPMPDAPVRISEHEAPPLARMDSYEVLDPEVMLHSEGASSSMNSYEALGLEGSSDSSGSNVGQPRAFEDAEGPQLKALNVGASLNTLALPPVVPSSPANKNSESKQLKPHGVSEDKVSMTSASAGGFKLDKFWAVAPKSVQKPCTQRKIKAEKLRFSLTGSMSSVESASATSSWVSQPSLRPNAPENTIADLPDKVDFRPRCMLSPANLPHMVWGAVMGLALCVEALATPYSMCFQPGPSDINTATRSFATLVYFCDVLVNFNTGVHKDGMIVMRRKTVALAYVKTWFMFDIFLIALDLGSLAGGTGDSSISSFKALRLVRGVRLLRLLKLRRLLINIANLIQNDTMMLVGAIAGRLAAIMFIAHFMACGWYLCATYRDVEAHPNWVRALDMPEEMAFNKYMVSLHWSVSQIHGTMEVFPHNSVERGYAVSALLISLFVMAVLVGNFANLLANLWSTKNYKAHQLWLLRRYMTQLQVSNEVAERVSTYVQHVMDIELAVVDADSIEILKYLSTPLANELKSDSYARFTNKHALFHCCSSGHKSLVSVVDALSTKWMSDGDCVFGSGEELDDLFFLIDGGGTYYLGSFHAPETEPGVLQAECVCGNFFLHDAQFCRKCGQGRKYEQQTMAEPDYGSNEGQEISASTVWIGEPALWLADWQSRGSLEVREACQVAYLNVNTFRQNARNDPDMWRTMAKYASIYVQLVKEAAADTLSDVSIEFISAEDILIEAGLKEVEDSLHSRWAVLKRTMTNDLLQHL